MQKLNREKVKKIFFHILLTILINALCISLMLVLNRQYIHDENIFLLFILAVLIIVIETKSILYGIITSVLLCSLFNFFLTEPQHSFVMDDINYYISFVVFIIISIIFGSIVIQLQKKVEQSRENEKRINILYVLSKKFLNCHGQKEIFDAIDQCLQSNLKIPFLLMDQESDKRFGTIKELSPEAKEACDFSINQFTIVGKNQAVYSSSPFIIFPIRSKALQFGLIYLDLTNCELSHSEFGFLKSISTEAAVVLEREKAIIEQEVSEGKREKEHFKSTLLRSLSHDLKTHLTSIQSGSLFLKENIKEISSEETEELLDNIYSESVSLYGFVNNLLNISKLGDKQSIVMVYESLQDILQNVKDYYKNINYTQTILFPQVDDTLLVYCNAQLIIQVFVNLINNGLKYTRENSTIEIKITNDENHLFVEIEDNGGGIQEEKLKSLFDEEKTISNKKDAYRSNGLGLIICKAIIQAHKGEIKAKNNDKGGATFSFYLALKKEAEHDTDH